jgi:hypothetical protein
MTVVQKLFIVLLCVFTFFVCYRPLEIEDNWWHLSSGRWIVDNGSVPHEDPFPTFNEPRPWILTQWLGSVTFYLVYAWQGFEGLKFFRFLIFAAVMGIYFFYARRKIPFPFLVVILFLMEYGIAGRVLLRPDIFNYIFVQLFLILLFAHRQGGQRKFLWGLLGLGALWGNVHLGSFVFGYFLVFVFLSADIVRWFALKMEKSAESEMVTLARNIKDLAVVAAVYPLTFFVSPYGAEAGVYPFKVFFVPEFIHIYKFVNLIAEAFPPIYIFSPAGFWFHILCAAGIIALVLNKKDQLLHVFLFVFPLFLFLKGGRASAFFVLVTVYVIAKCAADRGFIEFWKSYRHAPRIDAVLMGVMTIVLTVHVIGGAAERVFAEGEYRKLYTVSLDPRLPDEAIDFLKEHKFTGTVFANDNLGGYLLWAAYPHLKPFVDGRQLHPKLFFKQVSALRQPQIYWASVAKEFGINIVLLDLSTQVHFALAQHLLRSEDWQLVFLKEENVIFVRRGAFELGEDLSSFKDRLRSRELTQKDVEALTEVSRIVPQSWTSSIYNPPTRYNELSEEATTLLSLGLSGAGVAGLIEAFDKTGDPAIPIKAALTLELMRKKQL